MKILNKSLVGLIASVLCMCNANAVEHPCPEGCFCLGDGTVNDYMYMHEYLCHREGATTDVFPNGGCSSIQYGDIVVVSSSTCNIPGTYYLDEFSEFYHGDFGFYGFIDNEFVYGYLPSWVYSSNLTQLDMFTCPSTYPHSEQGASALTQCFKYKANGAKEYYGANNTVACNEGYYLPANSTQCAMCQPSMGHVCPGGSFEVTNQIQGLKVWCNPREYLPAGATQCSTCDDNVYSCAGGVYDFNPTEDQGRIKHNGYLDILHPTAANPNAQHKYSTCKPGFYRPAGSISCAECTGNYACPGGMFFDDVTYNVARGRILCGYGVPNANHSACVAQTTSPSKMKKKAENESNIESAKPAPSKKMDVVTKNTAGTLSRSLSQRPEAPSMNVTEPEVVNTKPVVSRSAKAVPQTNSVHESENVRERPDVRRPSRSHERGQR